MLEKQTTAIDVFYGDVYITTTLATYTPSTVEFHNPDEVVSGLKNLISPQQVAQNLTGEIDSHSGEVCVRDADTDCGVISPDTVGVIFDEGRFRADLFINPNLLSVQAQNFNRYLPASSTGFSSINNLAFLYSGEDGGKVTTNLVGQSLFSLQQQRVITDWSYGTVMDSEKFNMTTLYWQMDQPDSQYQAGWFYSDSRYLSFMPSLPITGFRYSTSFKARTDLDFATGTQLQVYLPSRSRVNIYKDGKFISTGFYDPGNQMVDTSALPDGAYDIELRIVDSAGREERVTRFYVKTQRLAPVDQDLYFAEAGDVNVVDYSSGFPKSQSMPMIQGGYSHRLAEQLGLNVGGSSVDGHVLTETGLYYVRDFFEIEPRIMLGDQGTYGWSLSAYARYGDWGAYYQGRRLWSGYEYDVEGDVEAGQFQFYTPSLKQHYLGVSHTLYGGYLQLNYSVSERDGDSVSDLATLSYSKPFDYNGHNLVFGGEVSKGNNDEMVMFTLSWNFAHRNVNHSVSASSVHQRDEFESTNNNLARLGYRGSWYYNELRRSDMGLQWNAQIDQDKTELGLINDIRGPYGSSDFGINYYDGVNAGQVVSAVNADVNQGSDSTFQYSGMLSTVVGGENGDWGVGGRSNTQGALLVNVERDDGNSSAVYDLFVNEVNYAQVNAGESIVVPLLPYKTYTISLVDKGSEFVSFEEPTRRVTIYPGNLKSLKWKARSVGVLVGRIVKKVPGCFNDNDPQCWAPLPFARAKHVQGIASTDGDGYIQAEVYRSGKTFTMIKKGEECVIDYSGLDFSDGLAYAENDLRCVEIEKIEP